MPLQSVGQAPLIVKAWICGQFEGVMLLKKIQMTTMIAKQSCEKVHTSTLSRDDLTFVF